MGTVVFVIVMTIIFLIIGIFLLQGKGSWLIAGYNTASPEEKAKYDKSKLCKVTAIICFVVAFTVCYGLSGIQGRNRQNGRRRNASFRSGFYRSCCWNCNY